MTAIGSPHLPGLAKVTEEFGEVLRALGKVLAMGGFITYFDGTDLLKLTEEELGDALAAIGYFVDHNDDLSENVIERRREEKRALFEQWHAEEVADRAALCSQRPRRKKSCVEQWPECVDGDYHPSCCRFPKSCSSNADPGTPEEHLASA